MVGLTLVRAGLEADWSGRSLLRGESPAVEELGTPFAATGRFGEVFSNLRAGYVELGGADDGELVRSLGRTFVSLFLDTRCVMNSVETRLKLNTVRNGPEIHPPCDFLWPAGPLRARAKVLLFRPRPRDKLNKAYGGSVPQR
jgi:hypothetical protein